MNPSTTPAERINALAAHLATSTMQDIFGYTPKPWQLSILKHLFNMESCLLPAALIFLCQPTGGGKSMVQDVFAAAVPGITINIAPLLSLSTDQHLKFKIKNKDKVNVMSIHLDSYKDPHHIAYICDFLTSVTIDCCYSIIVFCSPQSLTMKDRYSSMVSTIISNGTLKLLCVGEVHLFIQFGSWFRSELAMLKATMYSKLLLSNGCASRAPILFMTATTDKQLLDMVKTQSGSSFLPSNTFWPSVVGMRSRNQIIRYSPTPQPMKIFNSKIATLLGRNTVIKFIVYANSRASLEDCHKGVKNFLDGIFPSVDVVLMVGPQAKEENFLHMVLFLDPASVPSTFAPRGCFATRALGAAGWDSPDIYLVFSLDFPTDVLSIVQEKGRAGRRPIPSGSDVTDEYHVCASYESFLYLLRQIVIPSTVPSTDLLAYKLFAKLLLKKQHRALLLGNLFSVLSLFVLPMHCQHLTLERHLANPFLSDGELFSSLSACGN